MHCGGLVVLQARGEKANIYALQGPAALASCCQLSSLDRLRKVRVLVRRWLISACGGSGSQVGGGRRCGKMYVFRSSRSRGSADEEEFESNPGGFGDALCLMADTPVGA